MLIDELKRRGVLRVAAVYAAAAFAVIQAADIMLPRLGLPDWTVTFVIVAAIVGFPAALILAWLYDIKRTDTRRVPSAAFWGIAIIAFVALGAWFVIKRQPDRQLNAELVAVLPFRVAGAAPDLAYLREGMVDLIAAKLGGTEGVRTVDSRTVLAAWRGAVPNAQTDLAVEQAVEVARAVGAGQLLLGEIVGRATKLVLTGSLIAVPSGKLTRATVEGSVDSLPRLVDRLAAQLIALDAGEDERRLESLVGTSLPALRAYLQGRQAYRRGAYEEAVEHYQSAVNQDSTFALAATGLAAAAGWIALPVQDEAVARAWSARDRLPPRDRVLLEAYAGERYPAPITGREYIAGAERAAQLLPDNVDAWYLLADALYHWGIPTAAEKPFERARSAFARAIQLDSTFSAPYEHSIELAAMANDTADVRQLSTAYLARHSEGETAELIRWLQAVVIDDERALAGMWQNLDSIAPVAVLWMATITHERQTRPRDLERYLPSIERHWPFLATTLLLNAGQPQRAARLIDDCWGARRFEPRDAGCTRSVENQRENARWIILHGLYGGLDTTMAVKSAALLESYRGSSTSGQLCALEQWRTMRGDLRTVNQTIAQLRSKSDGNAKSCVILLQAIAAVRGGRSDAGEAVRNLDETLAAAPSDDAIGLHGNLVVAELLKQQGDHQRALAALRRRVRFGLTPCPYLSAFLREEGRIAARVGDIAGARRAYSQYLALRANPEPAAQPEVDAVRRALAALRPDQR